MINLSIAAENLRFIMGTLSGLARNNLDEPKNRIKFVCHNGWITAYATDGYRLQSVQVPIVGESPDFSFTLEPFSLPKMTQDIVPCIFNLECGTVEFQTAEWTCRRKAFGTDEFLDVSKAIPQTKPCAVLGVNPKCLAEAIKPFIGKDSARNPIVMEIRSPFEPIVIHRDGRPEEIQLVLPVRL